VSGSGSSSVTITGTLAQINALLNTDGTSTVSYLDGSNTPGASTVLTLAVNDNGNTGGGALNSNDTATINITAVNDAPVNTVPAAQTISAGTPRFFNTANNNAISIVDVDVNATAPPNNVAQVQLSVSNGTLALTTLNGISITNGLNGSSTITIQGTIAALNGALASLSYLSPLNFGGLDTLTVTTRDLGHSGAGGPSSAASTVMLNVIATDPHLWSALTFPSQPVAGVHLFNPAIQVNPFFEFVALGYASTANFDPTNPSGPYQITGNIAAFDPFFLPEFDPKVIETLNVALPSRVALITPTISTGNPQQPVDGEGITFFVTQDANGHNVINRSIIGGDGSDNVKISAPAIIADAGSDTIFNLRSAPQGIPALMTYDVAWDQFNATAHTFSINFRIFNANNTTASSVVTPVSLTGVSSITSAPSWAFGGGGAGSSYLFAVGTADSTIIPLLNLSGAHDKIHFQGYDTGGNQNSLTFDIQPDLSHYASGATNHITQELVPTQGAFTGSQLQFVPFGQGYAVAWNETVTVGNVTLDQVEFAAVQPAINYLKQTPFPIADGNAQNVRVGMFNFAGQLYAVMVYGDNTETHIEEFDASGNEIASIVDPTTQTFGQFLSLGDGRIVIGYDNAIDGNLTSQYSYKIFDLRDTGLNLSNGGNFASVNDNQDKYIAGTHFNDTVVGENSVSNFYYYVGQDTGGVGPADHFTGGANGWNTAIFPDAISNYTISAQQADGSITITNIDPQHVHAGSLTIVGVEPVAGSGITVPTVQALAFGPSKDPQFYDGWLEASAGTLYLVAPSYNIGFNNTAPLPRFALIDGGATLEVNTPFDGVAAFVDTGGTLKLDAQAQNTSIHPNAFNVDIALGARQTATSPFDILDLTNASVSSATINGTTLTVNLIGGGSQTYRVIGQLGATPGTDINVPFVTYAGGTKLELTPVGTLWGSFTYPAQPINGEHVQSGELVANPTNGVVGFGFGSTVNYNTSNPGGPYAIARNVLAFDPFFLPIDVGNQVLATSTVTLPARGQFNLSNIVATQGVVPVTPQDVQVEGIAYYVTQNSGHSVINQTVITGFLPDSPFTIGSPTQIGNPVTNTATAIYNLDASWRQDYVVAGTPPSSYLSSEGIAWDQFNGSSYNIEFQILNFNPDGTPAPSPAVATVPVIASGANIDSLPAWVFRPGGPSGTYILALAQSDSTPNGALNLSGAHDKIHFQGYDTNGNPTSLSFDIQPNLTDFAFGAATNHITQQLIPSLGAFPGTPVLQIHFGQLSGANNNDYVIAWNETVTDTFGTHDQVELALVQPGTGVVDRFLFDSPNGRAQNVRVVTYSDPSGKDYAVLYYGDSSMTTLIEFTPFTTGVGTKLTPVAVVADPTTVAATAITSLGDGRIEVLYDNVLDANQTSQDNFKVFDLRTSGVNINDSAFNDGHAKYVAGTQFNDLFTGENGVNNTYYFVGAQTAGSPPSDIFHGGTDTGTGTSWNTAIFADDRANYTVAVGATTTAITNIDPQHLHAGTLTVDHVQALAFNPAHDPTPMPDGSLEASGGTLLLLSPFSSVVTMGSNTTLELAQPSTFGGHVVDFAPGNFIDFDGFDLSSAHAVYNGINGTLTVTDNTHTTSIALDGSYSTAGFTQTSDGHGGVDIGMTTDQAVSDNVIAPASSLQGSPGSTTILSSLLLANDTDSGGAQLSIAAVNASGPPPQHGSVQLLQSGDISYTVPVGFTPPQPGQQATDSFDYTLVDANGATSTGHVNLSLLGGTQIVGTAGNDILVSSSANETFTGQGGADTFVFKPGFGQDSITDFQPGQDKIDVDHTLFADFSAVQSHMAAAGFDTVITGGAGDTITLANVAPISLHASDFHLI
jgi:hypothetical protein